MKNIDWNDLRFAYQVATSATLTKAGEALGVNHATVLRRINRLEEALDTKLFIRHQRGYRLTQAGNSLLEGMPKITTQVNQLVTTITNDSQSLSGDLIISTVSDFAISLNPLLKKFQNTYPQLRIQIIATDERVPLTTGEAHVALRITSSVDEPDLIAHHLKDFKLNLFASHQYIAQHGEPKTEQEFAEHKWIIPNGKKSNMPSIKKLLAHIPDKQIVYQSNSFRDIHSAVVEGMGIGPIGMEMLKQDDKLKKLSYVISQPTPSSMWFVYHRDLKENQRIKAFLTFIKQAKY